MKVFESKGGAIAAAPFIAPLRLCVTFRLLWYNPIERDSAWFDIQGRDEGCSVEILEGTWEEIRAHDSELAGRRVRLILVDEAPNSLAETDPRWERFIGAVEAPEPTSASQIERDFGRILDEKHAKGNL